MSTGRDVALELLELGYRPFPINPKTKASLVKWKEYQERPPTPDEIEQWWDQWPKAAVGIVTGHPGGVCALDIDKLPKDGKPKQIPNPWPGDPDKELPTGCVLQTPSGAKQYLFASPEPPIANSAGKLAEGVDIRGRGGLTVVWGPGREVVYGSFAEVLETEAPGWLLEAIRGAERATKERVRTEKPGLDPATILAGIPEGKRDDTLYRYACRLRAQGLERIEAEALVLEAAKHCKPPFPPDQAIAKVDSAWTHDAGRLPASVFEPDVTGSDGLYNATWQGMGVSMKFRQVNRRKDGNTTADLTIEVAAHPRQPYHRSVLWLSSANQRRDLAATLARDFALSWDHMLETVCARVLALQDEGQPALVFTGNEQPKPVEYLMPPWLVEEMPVIFFGPGGSGKSYLALILSALLAKGAKHPALGWEAKRSGPVLWLDWETGPADFQRRLYRVCSGMNLNGLPGELYYRQCAGSIRGDMEALRQVVMEVEPMLIVCDSLSGAAGGDLNAPDSAIPFYEGMRTLLALNRASGLIIGHPPDGNAEKIYGSVFFRNRARDMWIVKGAMESGSSECYMLLKHHKTNIAGFKPHLGLRLVFSDDDHGPVRLFPTDVSHVEGVEDSLPVGDRILARLKANGAMSPKQLVEELEVPAGSVRPALKRLLDRGLVYKLSDSRYGAAAHADVERSIERPKYPEEPPW